MVTRRQMLGKLGNLYTWPELNMRETSFLENLYPPIKELPFLRVLRRSLRTNTRCESTYQWVPARGGSVPANALKAGMTKSGKTLYMGRLNHLNSLTPGKVHPSQGAYYIPLGGEELKFTDYEVVLAN
ncbi:putative farnesoic acid O-methyltransferase [Danaus plexippus plexippus]|uniref:Farnesoic acid O-methyltransferase n=1 Tax=Danaus plexippus plexippus TaxID=278856 RepID=A0A212EL10_DANPL|nr:putative farnesoic acid O-methyltransferase [Danaus plexippus plexippus]